MIKKIIPYNLFHQKIFFQKILEKVEKNNFFSTRPPAELKNQVSSSLRPAGGQAKKLLNTFGKSKNAYFEKSKQFLENLSYTKVR